MSGMLAEVLVLMNAIEPACNLNWFRLFSFILQLEIRFFVYAYVCVCVCVFM